MKKVTKKRWSIPSIIITLNDTDVGTRDQYSLKSIEYCFIVISGVIEIAYSIFSSFSLQIIMPWILWPFLRARDRLKPILLTQVLRRLFVLRDNNVLEDSVLFVVIMVCYLREEMVDQCVNFVYRKHFESSLFFVLLAIDTYSVIF